MYLDDNSFPLFFRVWISKDNTSLSSTGDSQNRIQSMIKHRCLTELIGFCFTFLRFVELLIHTFGSH